MHDQARRSPTSRARSTPMVMLTPAGALCYICCTSTTAAEAHCTAAQGMLAHTHMLLAGNVTTMQCTQSSAVQYVLVQCWKQQRHYCWSAECCSLNMLKGPVCIPTCLLLSLTLLQLGPKLLLLLLYAAGAALICRMAASSSGRILKRSPTRP